MSLLDGSGLGDVLDWMIPELRRNERRFDSVDSWWEAFRRARVDRAVPIDQAIVAGVLTDRIGYAFAGGYQAALLRLDPSLPPDRIASLSVTEEGGGHPQAIEATLAADGDAGFVLNGRKKWATLSRRGGLALVAAKVGTDELGRNRLRVARVDLGAPGVTVEPMPETEFVPEIHHGRLAFADVKVASEDLLPGDGYLDTVKPFRTLEDTFVNAAILTYLLGISLRYTWPREIGERILVLLVALRGLGMADPRAATTHLALEGLLRWREELVSSLAPHWDSVEPAERARWARDQALTNIAGRVRALRTDAAWKKVGRTTPGASVNT